MPRKIRGVVSGKTSRIQSATQATKATIRKTSVTGTSRPVVKKSSNSKESLHASTVEAVNVSLSASFWQNFRPVEIKLEGRRPDDLLVYTVRAQNLKVATGSPPRLIRSNNNKDALLIIELPPQHFGEEAFLDATGPEVSQSNSDPNSKPFSETDPLGQAPDKNVPTTSKEPIGPLPAVKMRMSGPSRLAFLMPAEVDSLKLTHEDILNACKTWPMHLSSLAVPAPNKVQLGLAQDWLQELAISPVWQGATQNAQDFISQLVSSSAVSAIEQSAKRITQQVMTDNNRTGRTSYKRLPTLINQELSAIQKRFAKLGQPDNQEAAKVLIALYLTRDLSAARGKLTAEIIDILDGLKLVLKPHQPPSNTTALELPYRVTTTPLPNSYWRHSESLVTHNERTELWHTRLSRHPDDGRTSKAPIRAIWSPDYELDGIIDAVNANPPKPFRMSLDPVDREMLVKVMAGFHLKQASDQRVKPAYLPLPAYADRLMLSAMGGLLDAEGSWDADHLPYGVGLEQWRHLAAMGRDQYVRVVYRGFLFPFGHSASLIKVTERKFESHGDNLKQRVAVLRQRFFIVIREPVRHFDGAGHQHAGRNFPFTSVTIKTRVTPNLRPPEQSAATPAPNFDLFDTLPKRTCFWPMLGASVDFEFDLQATDIAGKSLSFSMPLLFVGLEANQTKPAAVLEAYNFVVKTRRETDLHGGNLCFAPLSEVADAKGDPRLPTGKLQFLGAQNSVAGINDPQIYPEVEQAEIGIQTVQRMLNDPSATLSVRYPQIYKEHGFPTNPNNPNAKNLGEVFLEAITPFSLGFGDNAAKSDALGAIAAPSMDIGGLSRVIGSTADVMKVANNEFDPIAFFKDAKILGGISVADLLSFASHLADAPKMLSRELPDRIEASFEWQTIIKQSDPLGLFVHSPANKTTEFFMHGRMTTPLGQANLTTYQTEASLVNFKVNLFGFILIWFDHLRFSSTSGSKADVIVELHPDNGNEKAVEFGGPLEFVNQLSDIIPMDGFSDPPNIMVSPSGLTTSYSLAIPSIQVGIFALSNMSIGAGFSLPFNNEPMQVRFNFSERQSPFSLTVSLFGGGGFFAIGVGTEGVNEIEAALEFGAAISINLGVASGGVEVKAGVYFHWMQDSVELTGYVRLHGELSVLGLISASLTFNLQLSYLKQGNESLVWGEASLIVEVEVLVFSASVEVHCKREFAGSESDPTFLDLIPNSGVWADYCGAFAQEEAA